MTVIKRGQIAILSISLMAVVAGYINYKYNPEREKNLGQTMYVNGKDSFTYQDVSIYEEEEKENQKKHTSDDKNSTKGVNSTIEQNSIAVFKYDRDNMFSELSENYSNIIKNEKTSQEKITEYQVKLNELIKQKNLINMVENVIKSKGIKDIVIIPTDNYNINVVVSSREELKKEQIAQIQQILVDQLGAKAEKLSITVKK
ncbi:MAG: SpoIIIAH-like family protein [Clostridia bacterium]